MKELSSFKAVYCSGLMIPSQSSVAALSLIFDKVHIPNNIEFAVDFAKRYKIRGTSEQYKGLQIKAEDGSDDDPFKGLSDEQKETAFKYLDWSIQVARNNSPLFGEVFETNVFEGGDPLKVELVEEGKNGGLNKYRVSQSPMQLAGDDSDNIPTLIKNGFVPVVGNIHSKAFPQNFKSNSSTAKQLAAILAMQSIEMFFPAPEAVHPEIILEARDKLKEHLPVYWSSMLKLSKELKPLVEHCNSPLEVIQEGQELVDSLVRPSLIDLNHKIEQERKLWFYRIFGRVYKGLKMVAGKPPVTQEQLIKSSLLLGTDTVMGIASDLQKVETMKSEAGLTYLLELGSLLKKN
ncbi:hypothetical protein [Vibrio coralliirubri]|uniref:hypothetical protein n=1 Tax=Vibrio coralliirubri TaxID=1516159 RepID=UPI0006350ECB|nr:hypothetical protein [Vibrio coralliirubri]CDT45049.1 exported hypothetical protein [Vibrio coralliirubri]